MAASVGPKPTARRVSGSLLASLVATIAVLAATLGAASATTTHNLGRATRVAAVQKDLALVSVRPAISAGTFCGYAKNSQHATPSSADASATPTSLQAEWNQMKAEEPLVLSYVPSAIKSDYQVFFNFANKFYAALASVHWNFLKLTTAQFESLITSNQKQLTAASQAIQNYLKKTCGSAY